MRIVVAVFLSAALAGCVTTRSPSQAMHSYASAKPVDQVRTCVATAFTPRFASGVEVQGGWPDKPVDMTIVSAPSGTLVTTRGLIDRRLAACL